MQYTDKSIEERQSHIDLDTPCQFAKKARTTRGQMWRARKNLAKLLGIDVPKGRQTHCCHLCSNHSRTKSICINPNHLYFGTPIENYTDKTPKAQSAPGKSPNNPCQLKVICPHCGKVGTKMIMARWHFDNCSHH